MVERYACHLVFAPLNEQTTRRVETLRIFYALL
jgi:hypothetical protein